jgi:hypothetical protein
MITANDNLGGALAGFAGLVEGGVDHAAKATFGPGPRSCGSFRKVSALQSGAGADPHPGPRCARLSPSPPGGGSLADLAGRYVSVQRLQARPVLRLVDRLA